VNAIRVIKQLVRSKGKQVFRLNRRRDPLHSIAVDQKAGLHNGLGRGNQNRRQNGPEKYFTAAFGSHPCLSSASLHLDVDRKTVREMRSCVAAFILFWQLLCLSVVALMATKACPAKRNRYTPGPQRWRPKRMVLPSASVVRSRACRSRIG
jgi:hypothetical protein